MVLERKLVSTHSAHVEEVPSLEKRKELTWANDPTITDTDDDGLLTHLRKLPGFCMDVKFKRHPSKCRVFRNPITRCWCLISAGGVKYKPSYIYDINYLEVRTQSQVSCYSLHQQCTGY